MYRIQMYEDPEGATSTPYYILSPEIEVGTVLFSSESYSPRQICITKNNNSIVAYDYVNKNSQTYQYGYTINNNPESIALTGWIDLGGGNAVGGIIDVESLPTSNIKNTFYRTKEDIGGRTRTIEVSLSSEMSFDEKVAYLSQYFIVHPDQANNRIDIETYPDLYMTRASWTKHYSVPEETLALMYLDTERIELHYDADNSGTPQTETSLVMPLLFSSSHFPSAVYYAGDEINQTTERMATYEDIPKEFTGTQAEWDALTTDEKLEYTTVNITDDDGGTNLDYYSTEETKTNKRWIDGKPIYRKVYKCTTATSLALGEDWKRVPGWDVDTSDMAVITFVFGSVYNWGRIDWVSLSNKLAWCCLNSNITIPIDAALTIEYTKIED